MTATLIASCDYCGRDMGRNPILGRHGLYCTRTCEARDAAECEGPQYSPQERECCACPPWSTARDCPHLICGEGDEAVPVRGPCDCACHREEDL